MTCGLLTNPKGKPDRHRRRHQRRGESGCGAEPRRRDHTAYKAHVTAETAQLVSGTKAFTDAVKAGDIEKAKRCTPRRVSITSARRAHCRAVL